MKLSFFFFSSGYSTQINLIELCFWRGNSLRVGPTFVLKEYSIWMCQWGAALTNTAVDGGEIFCKLLNRICTYHIYF